MPTALHIAGLPSQPHQGIGARLVRRLGGAVRSAIVRGITLAAARRRASVPRTRRDHTAPQVPQAPTPERVPVPRRPRPALPAPLRLPPLLAHLLASHRRPVAARRSACLNHGNKPFTPEAFPQLGPKACAVLNTPLKDCDPKTLELLVSALAQHINQVMSPESGITDPAAALPNLWHRISTALDDTDAETSLPAKQEAVPTTPADALPDAPVASPTDAIVTAAVSANPPDTAAPSAPVVHRSRSFRYYKQSSTRWRRCDSQPGLPRRIRVYLCASVVPFSCCHYAASTGPP